MSVSLEPHFAAFIERQIEDGHYRSANRVVEAGLQLLEEQQAYVAAVRAALIEGEQSGPSEPFDFDELIARKHDDRARRNRSAQFSSAD